jgi:iron-sulfur cluster repair protein YtfE (RIC family)
LKPDLDARKGWPAELRVVLDEHPRETWTDTRSTMARFWIDKHNYIRRQSEALQSANADYQADHIEAAQFGGWVAPRLQGFLAELHGHHQVEDFHYFPAFRSAEPRLAAGFDALARDHELIHQGIVNVVEAVNAFLGMLGPDAGENGVLTLAADRYVAASKVLHDRLNRHLADEEDLIIPLMIRHDQEP